MSDLNKTPYLIMRMICAYEKQVKFLEELLRTHANDGNDAAACASLELSTQERLIGMMQLIQTMQLEEDCYNGFNYAGSKTAAGESPATYCDRAIVSVNSREFKVWRCHYYEVY